MMTTAIASTATAPFALYHFQQVASYGLLTNLLAVPLTALWIMPWGLAAYLLMPLGLEALALAPMGWGISALLAIAEAAAGWPHAAIRVAIPPGWALGLASMGGLWLCLWRGRWRLWGLAGVAAGLIVMVWPGPGPDILISENGRLMAVRGGDGGLSVSEPRRDRFTREIWLRADGQFEAGTWPTSSPDDGDWLSCDPLACLYRPNGLSVALIRDARALLEDCSMADIVVAGIPVPRFCRAEIIVDRFDVWRHGAHAITFTQDGPVVARVADRIGLRPWTPGSPAGLGAGWNSGLAVLPDQADEPALHLDPVRTENAGLIGRVGRFQGDRRALLAQPFQGHLLVVDQGHDDGAVLRRLAPQDDHGVAVIDAGIDHAVAGNLERIMIAVAKQGRRHVGELRMVAQCLDRRAGGDLTI